MTVEKTNVKVELKDYSDKLDPEASTAITNMCLNTLYRKVEELKDLYMQLAKTYSFEMCACDITVLVQVSSPLLPNAPVCGLFGTDEGIEYALKEISKHGAEKNG